jgi:hypothetical protein
MSTAVGVTVSRSDREHSTPECGTVASVNVVDQRHRRGNETEEQHQSDADLGPCWDRVHLDGAVPTITVDRQVTKAAVGPVRLAEKMRSICTSARDQRQRQTGTLSGTTGKGSRVCSS